MNISNISLKLDQFVKPRKNALSRHVKATKDPHTAVSKALTASATHLSGTGDKLTLVCQRIGEAMKPEAGEREAKKLGGAFINFLHYHDWIDLEKVSDHYRVFCKEGPFSILIEGMKRNKRKANITTKPDAWHKPFNRGVPIVKRLAPEDQHHYTIDKMPQVYKALNVLQETEWTINERVLELMEEGIEGFSPEFDIDADVAWARKQLAKMKSDSLSLEEWILKQDDKVTKAKARVIAKGKFKEHSKDVRQIASEYSDVVKFVKAVELAQDVLGETLYYQHQADSRGRLYPLCNELSPQGPDAQKALLKFANSGPVSEHWIKVHIANSAGQDKLSFDDRAGWVDSNIDAIRAIGQDPAGNVELLHHMGIHNEKKTKWQFIAACMEFVQYEQTGEWFIPVGVDATSSGLQFLSAIARDESIAEDVNISTCSYAPVGDLYQRVGNAVKVAADPEKFPSLAHLSVGDKPLRKLVKRSCMTFPYSCQGASMGEHTYEDRGEYGDDTLNTMSFGECSNLGNLFYSTIRKELPRAAALMDSMQDSFNGYDGDPTVTWTTPTGFRAFQHKPQKVRKRLEIPFDKRPDVKIVYWIDTDKPSIKEHKMGVIANVVHSLDASLMVMTICGMAEQGYDQFHAVHDQAGSFSGATENVSLVAREAFYSIVTSAPIANSMRAATGSYTPPQEGNWNPADVLESRYFFC